MSRPLTVALGQLRWSGDPARNVDQGLAMAAKGFAGGADIVVLPELAAPGSTVDPLRLAESAQTLNGPAVKAWQRAAAVGGGYIIGGLCERDGERLFDSAVLVSGDGVLARYRKAHLFAGEKNVFAPGDTGFPVVSTPYGTFGLCICYDLRFVEVLRILALQGAELVAVPSAWVSGFDLGARSADEAVSLLAERGDDAKLLAGGQSLVAMMNFRLARPAALVDISRLAELRYVRPHDGGLRIGALALHRDLERLTDPGLLAGFGMLPRAARYIGHYAIRAAGTFGGSIAHADPAAEWCMAALLFDAQVVARSPGGERVIPVASFFH